MIELLSLIADTLIADTTDPNPSEDKYSINHYCSERIYIDDDMHDADTESKYPQITIRQADGGTFPNLRGVMNVTFFVTVWTKGNGAIITMERISKRVIDILDDARLTNTWTPCGFRVFQFLKESGTPFYNSATDTHWKILAFTVILRKAEAD